MNYPRENIDSQKKSWSKLLNAVHRSAVAMIDASDGKNAIFAPLLKEAVIGQSNSFPMPTNVSSSLVRSSVVSPFESNNNNVVPIETPSQQATIGKRKLNDLATAPASPVPRKCSRQQCPSRDAKWQTMFERLLQYKKVHQTTLVPERYSQDPSLGMWVHYQRRHCKDADKLRKLNSIGFHWDVRNDNWMEFYHKLVAYKVQHHHTRVPRDYPKDPKLGLWVFTQRRSCKKAHRKKLLNDIGFDWDARNNLWNDLFQRLVQYKEEHQTTHVPQGYKPDPQLARWVHNQRQTCTDSDRVARLNSIGFEWRSQRRDTWTEMYHQLMAYKKEHGTTHVSFSSAKGNPKLARWVYNQRRSCTDPSRIDRLNAIGFDWDTKPVKKKHKSNK